MQPQKQYRGESRMDYLTRTEADEMEHAPLEHAPLEHAPLEWDRLTWAALGGFAGVTAAWVTGLLYFSYWVLS